jgi:hypothetical protein
MDCEIDFPLSERTFHLDGEDSWSPDLVQRRFLILIANGLDQHFLDADFRMHLLNLVSDPA